jgi:hypothetical protein
MKHLNASMQHTSEANETFGNTLAISRENTYNMKKIIAT